MNMRQVHCDAHGPHGASCTQITRPAHRLPHYTLPLNLLNVRGRQGADSPSRRQRSWAPRRRCDHERGQGWRVPSGEKMLHEPLDVRRRTESCCHERRGERGRRKVILWRGNTHLTFVIILQSVRGSNPPVSVPGENQVMNFQVL